MLFAREGAKLAIVYKEEETDARETAGLIEEEGGEVAPDHGRRRQEGVLRQGGGEDASTRFGRLDVLVNNAAEQHASEDLPEISEKQLEETFRTNIFGYIFMTQAALKHMRKGAAIVNTDLGHRLSRQPASRRLLLDQGRDRRLHALAVRPARREGHPRQRRRARTDLDAAHSRRASTRRRWRSSARTCRSAAPASRTRSRRPSCSSPATIPPTSPVRCCIRTVAK